MRAALLTLLLAVSPAIAQPGDGEPRVHLQPVTYPGIHVIDGDTITVNGEHIRLLEIDTPETWKSRCANEYRLGLIAKTHLEALLAQGELTIERHGRDRYRRTLATVWVNRDDGPINVSEDLLRSHLALPYSPGGAAKLARLQTWCGPNARLDY